MKKKKLIVCLLSLVMVLSLCLSLFAGCDKNKDNGQTKEPTVAEVLQTALENTAKGKYLNNMEISANLSVETTYGTSTNKYNVNLRFLFGNYRRYRQFQAGHRVLLRRIHRRIFEL